MLNKVFELAIAYSIVSRRLVPARQRCTNPKHTSWPRYGGRGILFCIDRTPENLLILAERFLGSIKKWPGEEIEMDRVDNNGHYEMANIRFVTRSINLQNTKRATGCGSQKEDRNTYARKIYAIPENKKKINDRSREYSKRYYSRPEVKEKSKAKQKERYAKFLKEHGVHYMTYYNRKRKGWRDPLRGVR